MRDSTQSRSVYAWCASGVTRAARVAALHELIREIPGPVLAPMIGYNANFLADRAALLAVPWASYPDLRRLTFRPDAALGDERASARVADTAL